MRALEVYEPSGRTITAQQKEHVSGRGATVLSIGLARERKDLFARIDRRVEEMIRRSRRGTEGLVERGYDESLKPLQTFTYRPVFRYLRGEGDLPELRYREGNPAVCEAAGDVVQKGQTDRVVFSMTGKESLGGSMPSFDGKRMA